MQRALRGAVVSLFVTWAAAMHAQSIVTVAGGGTDDGLAATKVGLYGVAGLAFDRAGNLYFAETSSNLVRRVNADGTILTLAGTGGAGYAGDGSLATQVAAFTTRTTCVAPGAPAFQFVPSAATAGSTYAIVWSPAAGLDADGGYLVERSTSSAFTNPETQVTTSAAAAFVATNRNAAIAQKDVTISPLPATPARHRLRRARSRSRRPAQRPDECTGGGDGDFRKRARDRVGDVDRQRQRRHACFRSASGSRNRRSECDRGCAGGHSSEADRPSAPSRGAALAPTAIVTSDPTTVNHGHAAAVPKRR